MVDTRSADGEARARAAGCPVVHLDYSREQPVGTTRAELERLRGMAPMLWNDNGGHWIATRSALVREIFQNPAVFTNDSVSPYNPDPPWVWIPSNINPPRHVQYRQILNHAFGPAAVQRVAGRAHHDATSA